MAKGPTEGQSRGVKLRDENGDGYGVKHTDNVPHVLVTSSGLPSGAATAANQTGGNQKTQIVDAGGKPAGVDNATETLQTIEYEHHEIHSGSSFTVSYKADIGNGATLDLLIVTPDTTTWAHMTYEVDVEAETDVLIYEAVTATAGSPVVAYNRDRNNLTPATVVVTSTPTSITAGTTIIRSYHLGSGRSSGGGARATHVFILKQNTKYLFRMTNATTNNNYMAVKLDWYEHTNK